MMNTNETEIVRSSICLTMIVKNEAHVIARCVKSVRPHITSWCIVDTGSTDGTQELISELLKDIPGELYEREWVDFATNRNQAIDLAKGKADYLLVVDADDVIVGACPHRLIHSHYSLPVEDSGTFYERCHLFRSDLGFHYVGVLHEYLECKTPGIKMVRLPSLKYRRYHEGARSIGKTKTYDNDIKVLTKAVADEQDVVLRSRYAYYLAQSYKDAGRREEAIIAYEARAAMPGFLEEKFIALYHMANMKELLPDIYSEADIEQAYLRAWEDRPTRIEPIYDLCHYLRSKDKFHKAYLYAKSVVDRTYTPDALFIRRDIYTWKMKDELAVSAFYAGDKNLSRRMNEELLRSEHLPMNEVPRITQNLRLSAEISELSFPLTNIPENQKSTGLGTVFDRMRENVGAGGTELGAMMTLFSLAISIRAETIVEIGRFRGSSTFALGSALKFLRVGWKEPPEAYQRREIDYARLENPAIDRKLYSIEIYPLPEVKEKMREDGLEPFITYIDKPSTEVTVDDIDGRSVDLCFIDGDHSYAGCLNDVVRFVPMLRKGALFVLHDFYGWYDEHGNNGSPIKQVCDVLEKDFEHLLIDTGYMSLMIFRKTTEAPPVSQ